MNSESFDAPRPLGRDLIPGLAGPLRPLRQGPRLLVFDFDGTLSPLAAWPWMASLSVGSRRALRRLVSQPGTSVAVLSGRSLPELRRLLPAGVALVGNHGLCGSRPGLGLRPEALAPHRAELRSRLPALRRLAAGLPGALVEDKGYDVALHYRNVAPARVEGLLRSAALLFRGSGLRRRGGNKVLEFGPPLGRGKAGGLRRLLRALAPQWGRRGSALFVGDDRTDEDAFAAARRLAPRFLTIKVGPGPSAAAWRLPSQARVDELLAALARFPTKE